MVSAFGSSCTPCGRDATPLTFAEAEARLQGLPGWALAEDGTRLILMRRFPFADFAGPLAFVNAVGRVAEREGHHPDLALGWGYATVTLWTHAINGLHSNDFVLAGMISALVREPF